MNKISALLMLFLFLPALAHSQSKQYDFDIIIKNGTIYDGTGADPIQADVGIKKDRIVAVGSLGLKSARSVVDATDLAVAPGFINMLSWSIVSFIAEGRSSRSI